MPEIRRHFHEDLSDLEQRVLRMGVASRGQVAKAVRALVADDPDVAEEVVEDDDDIDREGIEFERLWLQTMALQTPVAIDLRVMSVLQHINHSVLRIGDQAVNVAKLVRVTHGMRRADAIVASIREMGELVDPMLRMALEALERRDATVYERLEKMDDPVDTLNQNMYRQVVACADDPDELAWATQMMIVSRALERVGDRAVSIGAQVGFLVRGEFEIDDEFDVPGPE